MNRIIIAFVCMCALVLLLSGCNRSEKPTAGSTPPADTTSSSAPSSTPLPDDKEPPADVVIVNVQSVDLLAGNSAEAWIKLTIANGYHINGNPASKYQIATALSVEAGEGVTPGKTIYPPSISKKFEFSNEPIAVYEGDATIRQEFKADVNTRLGVRKLAGKLKIQPCDEHVCYPPRTIDVSIPAIVR
jgi:hypothetical protein